MAGPAAQTFAPPLEHAPLEHGPSAAAPPSVSPTAGSAPHEAPHDGPRRDFLKMTLAATAVVGVCMAVWPFLDTMDPAHIVVASSDVTVNIGGIPAGSGTTVLWKGQPVLIRHRTPAEITRDENVDILQLPDPASAASRVKTGHADWVVLLGAGPAGCVVVGNAPGDPRGRYGGWVSPCDGSQYDTAGRVRSGPATTNLAIPPYDFSSAATITIGL
jgi:ubiquinol-cytochrome c reductase iron-sulfur subunit